MSVALSTCSLLTAGQAAWSGQYEWIVFEARCVTILEISSVERSGAPNSASSPGRSQSASGHETRDM